MSGKKFLWKSLLGATDAFGNKLDLSKPTLLTIGFSHFSERARWLLDLTSLKYIEDRHLPAFHLARTMSPQIEGLSRVRMPGCKADDSDKLVRRKEKTAVPKLILPIKSLPEELRAQIKSEEGACIIKDGSKGISRFVTHFYSHEIEYLRPKALGDEIDEIEELLESVLAPAITNFAFGNFLLCDRNSFLEDNQASRQYFINSCANTSLVPEIQKLLFKVLGKHLIVPTMIQGNGIAAAGTVKARKDILAVFDRLEQIRKNHRCPDESPHLLNTEQPTLADISLASFMAPLILPSQLSSIFFDRQQIMELQFHAPGCLQYLKLRTMLLEKYSTARAALKMYDHRNLKSN